MKKTVFLIFVLLLFSSTLYSQQVDKLGIILELQNGMKLSKETVQKISDLRFNMKKRAIENEAKLKIAELEMQKLMRNRFEDLKPVKAKLDEMALIRSANRFFVIETEVTAMKLLSKQQRQEFGVFIENSYAKRKKRQQKEKIRKEELFRKK